MRIRIIDAFTDRPFAGNPAAVCLLDADAWPDEGWMRQVAAELNLSNTAFAHPLPEPAVLPEHDRARFMTDFVRAFQTSAEMGQWAPLAQTIRE